MQEILQTLDGSQIVLDLGAGEGSFCYSDFPATVVALDRSVSRGVDPAGFSVVADSGAIPLASNSVDLIICNNTLEHFEELDETLSEISRVLKPRGILWASVPDGKSFDDRFYRLLFSGGGHLNRFTLDGFLARVREQSRLEARTVRPLHSGFVFLNPPDLLRLRHYPRRARFLGWVPARILRRTIRWLNLVVRAVDRSFGTGLSRYGWAVSFAAPEQAVQHSLEQLPAHLNVCFGCGRAAPAEALAKRRFLFWQVYDCPLCSETNFWFSDPEAESGEPGVDLQNKTSGVEEPGAGFGSAQPCGQEALERAAREIFGPGNTASIRRWVDFWGSARRRASFMLESLRPLALMDLRGKRILDVGCGTGGMGEVLEGQCASYFGVDPTTRVIRLARRGEHRHFVEASGAALPFADDSFDYVFALDVLEHVQGGFENQVTFLKELRRVASPLGMICLSTPNRLYPHEGHTGLFAPQYLPEPLRRWYIQRFNPGFLQEHESFNEITSLTPNAFRKSLRESGLAFLHELPCGLDRADFIRHFPIRGLLAYVGLGWYPHAEFWGVLVESGVREKLRLKLPKFWTYEQRQPSPTRAADFGARIDFDAGFFNPQLESGWYWHEHDRRGFRWIGRQAACFLQAEPSAQFLNIHGYGPRPTRLQFRVNGLLVGVREISAGTEFHVSYLVPFQSESADIWRIQVECEPTFTENSPTQPRQLGVMVFSVEMSDSCSIEVPSL